MLQQIVEFLDKFRKLLRIFFLGDLLAKQLHELSFVGGHRILTAAPLRGDLHPEERI